MKPNAGVYALTHLATGKVYIGSSKNLQGRRKKWQSKLTGRDTVLPPTMQLLAGSWRDWKLTVLWDGTGATAEQLEQQEARALALVRLRAPDRVLNELRIHRPDTYLGLTAGGRTLSLNAWSRETGIPRATISVRAKQLGWTPEQAVGIDLPPVRDYQADARKYALAHAGTIILDDSGEPITVGEAAAKLGCKRDTLSNRLRKRRVIYGESEVTLAELRSLSEKFRHT